MKKLKNVSFLIFPDNREKPISFKINAGLLKVFGIIFSAFFIVNILFAVFYGNVLSKVIFIKNLEDRNAHLEQENVYKDEYLKTQKQILSAQNKIKTILGVYEREEKAPVVKEKSFKKEELISEKDIENYLKSIKLRRNMEFLKTKDDIKKQKLLYESIPNILPVDGWITRGFDTSYSIGKPRHYGIDIAASMGSPIKASAPGMVLIAGWRKDYGNFIELDHGFGFKTRYGHCSRLAVKRGDYVSKGMIIGFLGNTGMSTAPHLHFEVVRNGVSDDPLKYLAR
ncbi:MAG: peptidoglycan DD-metalloendopeptidase family protein [Fibrobacterota bacterium]